ncbi:MAG TPA: ribonuclease III [Sedimentisphaerales bacterium]|nr:ribonuclease III [Sedimentisphaerales bacterium]
MNEEALQQVEQIIGYSFSNRSLLAKAFTHASGVETRLLSNERLEFLGDALLAAVICQTLFERFPGYLEGELTKMKSMLVSRRTCARVARQLGLHHYLQVGKGMSNSRALTGSLSAGMLEALVAVIYIDGGFEAARDFILSSFSSFIDGADTDHAQGNFKSLLQQYAQQQLDATPAYELLDEKGPDHDKCFESQVVIGERYFRSAWGTNKKEAEQKAAFNALVELGALEETQPESSS